MSITAKGMIFSLDLLVAVLIMLLMTGLFLIQSSNIMEQEKSNVELLMLEKEALARLDRALKKDPGSEQPGIAYYNFPKRRVEENLVELSALPQCDEGIFYEWLGKSEEQIYENSKDCLVLKRLALAADSKQPVLVGVKICGE